MKGIDSCALLEIYLSRGLIMAWTVGKFKCVDQHCFYATVYKGSEEKRKLIKDTVGMERTETVNALENGVTFILQDGPVHYIRTFNLHQLM